MTPSLNWEHALAQFAVEFDFIEDESGNGRFVAAGGSAFQTVSNLAARGDIEAAAALYEDSAHGARDSLLQEAKLSSNATRRSLIEVLKRARDFSGAAFLCESLGAIAESAQLYENANQLETAARAWHKAGEPVRAAAVLERLGNREAALQLYRTAQDRDGEARCLAHLGYPLEAAQLYRALKNAHAELQLLLAVPADNEHRRAAVLRACELLDENGHPQKALGLITHEMRSSEKLRSDFAVQTELVRLLRRAGRNDDADKVLAKLQGKVAPMPSTASPAAPVEPSPDEGYAYLKAIPLFAELALEDMKDLYRVAQRLAAPAEVALIQKGTRAGGLYVLLEGEVEVRSGPESDARLLNTLGKGAWLGEISLVLDTPTSAHVRTRTKVKALLISHENFARFVDTHGAAGSTIWRLFTKSLAERVRALSA